MKPEDRPHRDSRQSKNAIDFGSLKIRLWLWFGLFAVILVAILWLLQVFFLNNFYEDMKYRETMRIVSNIEGMFKEAESISTIRDYITSTYRATGIYIQIETLDGNPIVIPLINFDYSAIQSDPHQNNGDMQPEDSMGSYFPTIYRNGIDSLKKQLAEKGPESFPRITLEPMTERKTLENVVFFKTTDSGPEGQDDWLVLFVFSPLYPQESTAQILTQQLVYITFIAVLLSLLLGFYLARMITQPLSVISKRARELAAGSYGIKFPAAQYTEIIQLANTLSATSNQLAATQTMQRDIIANVSHDLKTPLTMIRSYAEMIRDLSGDDPMKRKEHLRVIMDETDRLSVMIAELLDISKLQTGEITLKKVMFPLKDLIQSTVEAYRAYIEQDGYSLDFVCEGEGIVFADETRIKQALDNLISNALKYGGEDKSVFIHMREADGFVRVEVTDHGVGIPKRDLKYIWDRYYKSSTHHQRSDSTGLGLSIVKEILLLHGARFGAESAVGRGSTFWFEIPLADKKIQ